MFYTKGVDICSTKSMFNFINNHFTYWTMNSWNGLKSIANNVKLYNLNLDNVDNTMACIFDECDSSGLCIEINRMISDWEDDHEGYSLGFNGHCGGYLVMYNEDRNGRVNFRNILPDWLTGYDTYEEWKDSIKSSYEYYSNVKDYKYELREYTKLIRDFDKLCDDIRDMVNEFTRGTK